MSDFILIIPEGWTQMDWQHITNSVAGMSGPEVSSAIQSGVLLGLETMLKEAGEISVESSLVEAKLIDDTYFLVRLG